MNDENKCNRCEREILDEELLSCTACWRPLHHTCGGVTLSNFRKMGAKKDQWKCPECKAKVDVPVLQGTNELETLMRNLFKELSTEIKSKINDFEKAVQFNSKKMDEMLTSFSEMKKSFKAIQDKHEEMCKENELLKKTVKDMKMQMVGLQQKSLDHNLEVIGVPEAMTDPDFIMGALCKAIKVEVPSPASYTLKRSLVGALGKPKSIQISFESKRKRDEILKAGKKIKPKASDITNNPSDVNKIFVNEQLSPHLKELFFKANNLKKEKGYLYLWVQDGKILFKKAANSKTIEVQKIEDLK